MQNDNSKDIGSSVKTIYSMSGLTTINVIENHRFELSYITHGL
jgi:hypothetical protein